MELKRTSKKIAKAAKDSNELLSSPHSYKLRNRKAIRKPDIPRTPAEIVDLMRLKNLSKQFKDSKIRICPITAQADLTRIRYNPKKRPKSDLLLLHMFDSRWTPGYISDPKLKKYIQQGFDMFEKEYYVRSR